MSLQENKNQMFEILKNNEEFLNKEENKDLKMLILYLKNEQRMKEMTIKSLRNGVEDLERRNELLRYRKGYIEELEKRNELLNEEILKLQLNNIK